MVDFPEDSYRARLCEKSESRRIQKTRISLCAENTMLVYLEKGMRSIRMIRLLTKSVSQKVSSMISALAIRQRNMCSIESAFARLSL
jgi:hypothetical protein